MKTDVVMVTTPKRTHLQGKMGEGGGGMHDNSRAKEKARRLRMLMTTMMVVVDHDDLRQQWKTQQ